MMYLASVDSIDKTSQPELAKEPPIINEVVKSPGGRISRRSFTSPVGASGRPDDPSTEDNFGEWMFGPNADLAITPPRVQELIDEAKEARGLGELPS